MQQQVVRRKRIQSQQQLLEPLPICSHPSPCPQLQQRALAPDSPSPRKRKVLHPQ